MYLHVLCCTCTCASACIILCNVFTDEEGDMDVHDRGVLYYRLLKHDVKEAQKVVCGQTKTVVETNTVIPRVSRIYIHVLILDICM